MRLYSLYPKISETEFNEIKSDLNTFEKQVTLIMESNGFKVNNRDYDDLLCLDYVQDMGICNGNIGLAYDAERSSPGNPFFCFYLLKSLDSDGFRYYRKVTVKENCSLEHTRENCIRYFSEALAIFNAIKTTDLTEKIRLKP